MGQQTVAAPGLWFIQSLVYGWIGLDPSCVFSGFVIAGGEAGGEGHVHVAAAGRTHSVDYISPHFQLFLPSYGEFCLCKLL